MYVLAEIYTYVNNAMSSICLPCNSMCVFYIKLLNYNYLHIYDTYTVIYWTHIDTICVSICVCGLFWLTSYPKKMVT